MTPEEIERTIQFILQHEAEVFARIDRLSSTVARFEREGRTPASLRCRELVERTS